MGPTHLLQNTNTNSRFLTNFILQTWTITLKKPRRPAFPIIVLPNSMFFSPMPIHHATQNRCVHELTPSTSVRHCQVSSSLRFLLLPSLALPFKPPPFHSWLLQALGEDQPLLASLRLSDKSMTATVTTSTTSSLVWCLGTLCFLLCSATATMCSAREKLLMLPMPSAHAPLHLVRWRAAVSHQDRSRQFTRRDSNLLLVRPLRGLFLCLNEASVFFIATPWHSLVCLPRMKASPRCLQKNVSFASRLCDCQYIASSFLLCGMLLVLGKASTSGGGKYFRMEIVDLKFLIVIGGRECGATMFAAWNNI